MKKFFGLVLLLLLAGCGPSGPSGPSMLESKTANFEELHNKVISGDVDWVRSNAPSVMSLWIEGSSIEDSWRDEKWERDGWGSDWFTILKVRDTHALNFTKLYSQTDDEHVKDTIVEVLKHDPGFKDADTKTLVPRFTMDASIILQTKILQRLGELRRARERYDLTDSSFVKDELCRAVGDDKLEYAIFLSTVAEFDPGVLRCYDTGKFGWGEYAAFTGSQRCPMSLRRVSGVNAGAKISARNSAFLRNLGKNDWEGMEDLSEIKDAFRGSLKNLPNLSGIDSMNDYIDTFNKWGFGGNCTLNSYFKGGEANIPKGF